MVIALGLGAALLLAVGFVLQQHTAASAPSSERLSPRLLLDLARRPVWIAGIGAMVGGQLLGAAALGNGQLTLVEPLLAANVLFALPLAAAWRRRRIGRRELLGAVVLVAGLAVFVVAAQPGPDRTVVVPDRSWAVAATAIIAVVASMVAASRRLPAGRQATLLGLAAGTLFGLQDALTQRTLQLHFGFVIFLETWSAYAVVLVAVAGILLAQSAYNAAPLAASLPAQSIAEPVTGIGLGAGLFAQGLRLGAGALSAEVLGIVAMVVGLYVVSRSPIVSEAAPRAGEP